MPARMHRSMKRPSRHVAHSPDAWPSKRWTPLSSSAPRSSSKATSVPMADCTSSLYTARGQQYGSRSESSLSAHVQMPSRTRKASCGSASYGATTKGTSRLRSSSRRRVAIHGSTLTALPHAATASAEGPCVRSSSTAFSNASPRWCRRPPAVAARSAFMGSTAPSSTKYGFAPKCCSASIRRSG